MTLYYVGLESYPSRYTEQLKQWNIAEFERLQVDYHDVTGKNDLNDGKIKTGSVLDAHGRSYYACSQIMELVRLHSLGGFTRKDVIFFEDMFHPGISSLPYIFNQCDIQQIPRVYVRCLAQTIDPDDFVHAKNMFPWMRPFEQMVTQFVDGILCASEEMIANFVVSGMAENSKAKFYVTGLPFGKKEVQSRVKEIKPFYERKQRVVFSSRWESEKQPHFYMNLVKEAKKIWPDVEFSILSGVQVTNKDNPYSERLKKFVDDGSIVVYENLSKNEYYEILNDSRVLFNCALQDWVSNTISEADALGCNVLFPAYRSFPETLFNDHKRLFVPWSQEDALDKMYNLLHNNMNTGNISDHQDKTIERTLDILLWKSGHDRYYRDTKNKKYRDRVSG